MLAMGLIFLGVLSRLVIHLPNFTPVMAIALFGGATLNKRCAVIVPVVLMAISDVFLGFHDTILFTWGSAALIAVLGLWLRERKNFKNIALASLGSAVLFFVVTNFGAWLSLYPRTLAGLQECFLAAVPFFRSTLVSTMLYSAVFFGGYEISAAAIQKTRWAKIFLSA